MNDPFAAFDPIAQHKHAAGSSSANSYATMPTPMPLAAPAAGPFNQFGNMPPGAPFGSQQPGMMMNQNQTSNPFGMGMMPLQTMANHQPMNKMYTQQQQPQQHQQHSGNMGAAFMTQPGAPAFNGLGGGMQAAQPTPQYAANPFGAPGAPQSQQAPQGNANPFGAQPVMYASIQNLLQPKPAADPFATGAPTLQKPTPLQTQSSTIMDFDPFSPSANTPRMPQTVNATATQDRTGSGGASALAERQNRARQTQDAARNQLGFDTNAFQNANNSSSTNNNNTSGNAKVSLKNLAPEPAPKSHSTRASAPAPAQSSTPGFDDSPFFSEDNTFAFAGQTVTNLDDDFAPSAESRTNSWGQASTDDDVAAACGPNEYDVTFESGRKLGVLMERVDVWSGKREDRRQEIAVVKLVVENGAADRVNVTIGSSVLAINHRSVLNDSYTNVLDLIKTAPRPMTIRFKRGSVNKDNTQGCVLTRISNGTFSVGNLTSGNASWTPKYFAYGGAKLDVLQLFISRAAYHECVISLYEKRAVHTQIQSFRLCRDHKISPIKSKIYKGYGNLHYFSLTVPSLRFVAAKFASEDYETIKHMWSLAYEAIERKKRMGY